MEITKLFDYQSELNLPTKQHAQLGCHIPHGVASITPNSTETYHILSLS